jgi:RNA polymerase sigma-70 factor (ECF subfamily)
MTKLTDQDLMARVKAGDVESFETLVERHKGAVYGLALSMLRRREEAEEAAQDAFLKLFRRRELFDSDRALTPWLLQITANTCRDRIRRMRVAELPRAKDADGGLLAQIPGAAETQTRQTVHQAVRHELARLSDRHRIPLELKYLHQWSNQQIAEALGISVSNVKVRVARAKDLLASRLGPEFGT